MIIKWRFLNTGIILESFASHSPFTVSLWNWQIVYGGLLIQYRPRSSSGRLDPYGWFDIIDEVSILTPWAASPGSLTLQTISAHVRIKFDGKTILFVGDLWQLSPWLPISRYLPFIASSQASLVGPQFENFQLQQPMRREDPMWNDVLLSTGDGQTHSV
jgi:hypothetical protein